MSERNNSNNSDLSRNTNAYDYHTYANTSHNLNNNLNYLRNKRRNGFLFTLENSNQNLVNLLTNRFQMHSERKKM
jgi:hypothetical protein